MGSWGGMGWGGWVGGVVVSWTGFLEFLGGGHLSHKLHFFSARACVLRHYLFSHRVDTSHVRNMI